MRPWKGVLLGAALAGLAAGGWLGLLGRSRGSIQDRLVRVPADPDAGFRWPYFLFVPEALERGAARGEPVRLIVLPNNTGVPDDDLRVHERHARIAMLRDGRLAEELHVAALEPVFPRPAADERVYTHALDRDCLTTQQEELRRLDLQLLAMIDHALAGLERRGWRVEQRVLLKGFSAGGMFADRFTALHPERVLAAVVGSPGGWPIAPVASWKGRRLRYPVGIADLQELTGRPFDAVRYASVPVFFHLGALDTNDSVPFEDGYDEEDRVLVDELFGTSPIERWPASEAIHAAAGTHATFHLDPGVGHATSPAMEAALTAFLRDALGR